MNDLSADIKSMKLYHHVDRVVTSFVNSGKTNPGRCLSTS